MDKWACTPAGVVIAKAEVSHIRGFTVIILRRIKVKEGSQSDSTVSSSVLKVQRAI